VNQGNCFNIVKRDSYCTVDVPVCTRYVPYWGWGLFSVVGCFRWNRGWLIRV